MPELPDRPPLPLGLLQPPPGPGNPGQDSPLAPDRLDPLADRHLAILPGAFRKLDAVAVLKARLLPAPRVGETTDSWTVTSVW